MKKDIIVVVVLVLIVAIFASLLFANNYLSPKTTPALIPAQTYVGVTYSGNSFVEAKLLIDKVKTYNNLFVVQSGELEKNTSELTKICKYAISSGLYIIVYFSAVPTYRQYITAFLEEAQEFGSSLLGIYFDDEPGGKILDSQQTIYFYDNSTKNIITKSQKFLGITQADGTTTYYIDDGSVEVNGLLSVFYESNTTNSDDDALIGVTSADYIVKSNGTIFIHDSNGGIILPLTDNEILSKIETYGQIIAKKPFQTYEEAARIFVSTLQNSTNWPHSQTSVQLFTSDYALYWYDYLGGYDVVLAEFGWNNTSEQQIASVRGAANLQSKDWGVIITWEYSQPPYLVNGTRMYEQMRLAYENGAKYIVVFNYPTFPEGNSFGILQDDHFEALQRFWNDTVNNQTLSQGVIKADTALVLPENYGWGLRNLQDNIWGLWQADTLSSQVWASMQNAIATYGSKLDIIYDNHMFSAEKNYTKIIYWNQTH